MSQIFVLSGPTGSGKSTRLFGWLKKQSSAAGIMQLVEDGQRWLLSWPDGEIRSLEELSHSHDGLNVGRFVFSRDAFAWGREALQKAAARQPDWLVIDEIGKLELRDQGLEPELGRVVKNNPAKKGTILVVRDELVENVLKKYGIKEYSAFKHA